MEEYTHTSLLSALCLVVRFLCLVAIHNEALNTVHTN